MKGRLKLLSFLMLFAAIACFGISLWLKEKKNAIDITKGSLSENVDRQMGLTAYVYVWTLAGIFILLCGLVIWYKDKRLSTKISN